MKGESAVSLAKFHSAAFGGLHEHNLVPSAFCVIRYMASTALATASPLERIAQTETVLLILQLGPQHQHSEGIGLLPRRRVTAEPILVGVQLASTTCTIDDER